MDNDRQWAINNFIMCTVSKSAECPTEYGECPLFWNELCF